MKLLIRLPIFIGIFIFVLSVLITTIKVGEGRSIANLSGMAKGSGASISMTYISPDTINIIMQSSDSVKGIDLALIYDSNLLRILPTTLEGGEGFQLTGGRNFEDEGRFVFSAIPVSEKLSGLVASFKIKGIPSSLPDFGGYFIGFDVKNLATAVYDSKYGGNILKESKDLRFSLPIE